jgi:hypothetical protein
MAGDPSTPTQRLQVADKILLLQDEAIRHFLL